MLIVEPADPNAPGPLSLIRAHHAFVLDVFPPEESYLLDIETLRASNVHFFAAREDQETLGIGALQNGDMYGEVKSMFTTPRARGKGVAAALLRQIEDQARAENLPTLKLETGEALEAAMRLYERHGFVRCGIFGAYQPNTSSIYLEKRLSV